MYKTDIELKIDADRIRIGILKGLRKCGAGHIGGSMSMAELMAVLYGGVMNIRPEQPQWEDRDWLVVSKGHCGPAVYSTLALNGFFPESELETINQGGTNLPSHCDMNKTPGVDMTTGSLGQGMSTALGVAFGNRYHGRNSHTYLLLGDGETQEGQVWEGAMFAAQQKLSNLTAFIDCNKKQLDGYTCEICDPGDLAQKFRDFGWFAQDCDGNDVASVRSAIMAEMKISDQPSMFILHTEKGLGCTFAEGVYYNHHVKFSDDDCEAAIQRLEKQIAAIQEEELAHV
ncbi:MAG: transketolase [Planctomycetaceae bacterium]|nr:transketolase [Planctomycetaceae bacterium]